MNREQRLLLGFLGIVLAIGAFIFQYVPLIEEEKVDIVINWPITAALVNKAEGWRVKGPSGLVSLKREQEKWRIVEPVQTQVNPEKMKSFLRQLSEVQPKKEILNPVDPKGLGLVEPKFLLEAMGASQEMLFELRLGSINKSEQTVAVSLVRSNGPVLYYALPRLMAFRLGLGLEDFRERRVWARAGEDNTTIAYYRASKRGPSFSFEVKKTPRLAGNRGSPFFLQKPVTGAADEKRMRQMVALLSETDLKEMVSEAHEGKLEKWGLHKPVYTFKLENPDWERPVEIKMSPILEVPGAFYVARSDALWIGRFASEKFLQLDFDLNDVVDKRFFSFQLSKVRRWEIWDQRLGHLILEKKHGEFVMLAPQPAMVKEEVMYRSLKHFAYIEGDTLLLPAEGATAVNGSSVDKWTTKMSFYDSKNKRLGELLLRVEGQDILGSSSERSENFKISSQTLKYLPLSLDAWIAK